MIFEAILFDFCLFKDLWRQVIQRYIYILFLCNSWSLGTSAYRNKRSPDGPCVNPAVLFSMNSFDGAVSQDKFGESHVSMLHRKCSVKGTMPYSCSQTIKFVEMLSRLLGLKKKWLPLYLSYLLFLFLMRGTWLKIMEMLSENSLKCILFNSITWVCTGTSWRSWS